MMGTGLPQQIASRWVAAADQETATAWQRYMKSEMAFVGVRAPIAQRM